MGTVIPVDSEKKVLKQQILLIRPVIIKTILNLEIKSMIDLNEKMQEIRLLNQFDLTSTSSGIKIHSHEASKETIAAAERLFEKGLTDHVDGGYLTDRGIIAANHAQSLLKLLC